MELERMAIERMEIEQMSLRLSKRTYLSYLILTPWLNRFNQAEMRECIKLMLTSLTSSVNSKYVSSYWEID